MIILGLEQQFKMMKSPICADFVCNLTEPFKGNFVWSVIKLLRELHFPGVSQSELQVNTIEQWSITVDG